MVRRINLENVKKERERRVDTGRERERERVIDEISKMLALINFQLGQLHRRRRGKEGEKGFLSHWIRRNENYSIV